MEKKENSKPEEIKQVIREIKRKEEEEFQEKLKKMTPEEQEKAMEEANDLF